MTYEVRHFSVKSMHVLKVPLEKQKHPLEKLQNMQNQASFASQTVSIRPERVCRLRIPSSKHVC